MSAGVQVCIATTVQGVKHGEMSPIVADDDREKVAAALEAFAILIAEKPHATEHQMAEFALSLEVRNG